MWNRKLEKREHYFDNSSFASVAVANINKEKKNMVLQEYEAMCRTMDKLFGDEDPFA